MGANVSMSMARPGRPSLRGRQRGFIMMVGLILLVVVTLLSVSMFRGYGLQEKMAGNTRDKQRSFEAAQATLQFGEWWLLQAMDTSAVTCSGVVSGNTIANMRVCTTPLATPEDPDSWTARIDYIPPGMAVASAGGLAASNDINYLSNPRLHLHFLGVSTDGKNLLYQVSALSGGGNQDTLSVVQSTFQVQTSGLESDTGPLNRKERD